MSIHKTSILFLSLSLASGLGVHAVTPITSITGSPSFASPTTAVSVDTDLTSLTTSAGTFSNLTGPIGASDISVGAGSSIGYFYQESDPGSSAAAITGLSLSTAIPNVKTLKLTYGSDVTAASTFFLLEIGGNDSVTFRPIDSALNVIGDYSLTVASSAYGPALFTNFRPYRSDTDERVSSNAVAYGVMFDLADFTGSGDLSDFSGFSISTGGDAGDIIKVGAAIPEPSEYALLVGLVAVFLASLYRRKR